MPTLALIPYIQAPSGEISSSCELTLLLFSCSTITAELSSVPIAQYTSASTFPDVSVFAVSRELVSTMAQPDSNPNIITGIHILFIGNT
jgi:hypothetical protein